MSTPDYSGNPTYRLSTAERDRAVTELRQHVAEGRLTEGEFAERSKAARNAVTRGDLAPLFDDLPATTFPASFGDAVSTPAGATPSVRPAVTFAEPPVQSAASTPALTDAVPAYGAPDVERSTPTSTSSATAAWKNPQSKEVGRVGATVMAVVPFVSLALFFVTGSVLSWSFSWLWFTLIPVAGIIIYGPNGKPKR